MKRALDLFCGAGGATKGLQRAGFHVTGVDLLPSQNYCGDDLIEADVLALPPERYEGFDFIWASPPCQAFTAYKRRPDHVRERDDLIGDTRFRLNRWHRQTKRASSFVIENVPGAPLINPVTLCGSMFGLDVRRHRLFEAHGFTISTLPCQHKLQTPRFAQATNRKNLRSTVEVGVWRISLETQQKAMGIDWMTLEELSQAIPPSYSEYIGKAAMV